MLFRLIFLCFKRLFYFKKQGLFEPCYTHFIVNPFDLDTNMHMNNGRYLSIMDLGRFDMLIKPRVFWKLIRAGYYPVVVSESIRFRKSLSLGQRFYIKTEIESWDEKDFYIKQIFYVKSNLKIKSNLKSNSSENAQSSSTSFPAESDEIQAVGYIKGRFKKRGVSASIPTPEIFKFLNQTDYPIQKKSALALAQDGIEKNLNEVIFKK